MQEHAVLVLLGVAGVAATFAGFSGVVAAFDRRALGKWFPEDHFRLTNMLLMSLGACLFAFVPLVGDAFHLPEGTLWTIASTLMGVFCGGYLLYAMPQRVRLSHSRHGTLSKWATAVFILSLCSATVLQALNAAAIVVERGAGPYIAGLSLILIVAGLQFAFLVLIPLASAESGDRGDERTADPAPRGR